MARRITHTVDREPIAIEMGGEEFTAPAILSPEVLGELLDRQKAIAAIDLSAAEGESMKQVLAILADIFDLVLEPESGERVRARLTSRDRAFDLIREVMPTIQSLVEEYTGRPTQPSPPSANGPTVTGLSTAGAPETASIPAISAVPAGTAT